MSLKIDWVIHCVANGAYKQTKKHSMPFRHVMSFPFLCRDGMPERRHCRVTTKPGTG